LQIALFAGECINIIVGIDGGKTVAIACLDLDGNLVGLSTGNSVGIEWFIENIRSVGNPVVIASDKQKPDDIAKKLASVFGAVLFSPKTDMSVEKKKELTSSVERENIHERDALAAARTAYNSFANKLKQADRLAKGRGADADMVKALVIVGKYSIYEAITGKKAKRSRPASLSNIY